jgi:hypothetical protein
MSLMRFNILISLVLGLLIIELFKEELKLNLLKLLKLLPLIELLSLESSSSDLYIGKLLIIP